MNMPSPQNITENPDWIGKLGVAGNISLEQIGSKIHTLARLHKMGLNVPDGFYITTEAYRNHIHQKDVFSLIQNGLWNPAVCGQPDAWLQQVRNTIIHTEPDAAFTQNVRNFYLSLSSPSLAVRSSATCEDSPTHSFAGQHDSFLGICDFPSCLKAILECWASLWTSRAFFYRQRNSIDHLKVEMAVLVQTIVRADCAGVIFTVNPVSGRTDQLVLESCRGLGKALVDGEVSPDRYIFDKHTLHILSEETSKQTISYTIDQQGCCRKQSLEPEASCRSSIEPHDAKSLARSVIQIETALGGPQDIEWAAEKGKFYFLQSRPVTTKLKEKTWEDRQIWSNVNSGEIMPDVVTPMTWSFIQRMLKPWFQSGWRLIGSDLGEHPLAGLVAGRVYFNLNTVVAAGRYFPKFVQKNRTTHHLLGGELNEKLESSLLALQKEDLPDLRGSLWKFVIRLPETLWTLCYRYRPSQRKKFFDGMCKKTDDLYKLDHAELSGPQLAQNFLDSANTFAKDWDLLLVIGALFAYPILGFLLKRWLHDDEGSLLNQLIRGQEGMDDVQAGFDLWDMASCVKEHPSLQKPLLSSGTWGEFFRKIESGEDGKKFLLKWNAFLARHGHHCRGELELFNPRWREMPDYVFGMVRNYYSGLEIMNPVHRRQADEKHRRQLLAQIHTQLRNPVKRWIISHYIKQFQQGAMMRENWKSQAVRYIAWLRKWLLVLGQKLSETGVLDNAQDVFFLRFDELPLAAASINISELRSTIKERIAEYQKNLTVVPPSTVIGRFDPAFYVPQKVNQNTQVFKGLSVYPGKVVGLARVILKADDKEHVLPGEILVAPFTDPGWTPYFLTAVGIVMDQGGLLSHGSIVAREFGIPAVVNVGPATKIIKTGQKLLLDADQGIVTVLKE
jgi:pyruvate,water dikinase